MRTCPSRAPDRATPRRRPGCSMRSMRPRTSRRRAPRRSPSGSASSSRAARRSSCSPARGPTACSCCACGPRSGRLPRGALRRPACAPARARPRPRGGGDRDRAGRGGGAHGSRDGRGRPPRPRPLRAAGLQVRARSLVRPRAVILARGPDDERHIGVAWPLAASASPRRGRGGDDRACCARRCRSSATRSATLWVLSRAMLRVLVPTAVPTTLTPGATRL